MASGLKGFAPVTERGPHPAASNRIRYPELEFNHLANEKFTASFQGTIQSKFQLEANEILMILSAIVALYVAKGESMHKFNNHFAIPLITFWAPLNAVSILPNSSITPSHFFHSPSPSGNPPRNGSLAPSASPNPNILAQASLIPTVPQRTISFSPAEIWYCKLRISSTFSLMPAASVCLALSPSVAWKVSYSLTTVRG